MDQERREFDALFKSVQELRLENELLKLQQRLQPLEHIISLPSKFDGSRSNCRNFINQVRLIFQLQPQRFPDDKIKISFIGTLLTGSALSWFSPLLERNSYLLSDLSLFLQEFQQTFGDFDRATTAANELRSLKQGLRSASEYAGTFRQISSDLDWGDAALIDQFRRGLRDDVKDLLLTMPIPSSLQEAISFAVRCDNRISERKLEKQIGQNYYHQPSSLSRITDDPIPMELDLVKQDSQQYGKRLSNKEKARRRALNLCLYCGGPGHIAENCQVKKSGRGKVRVQSL
jgi:hypothetical protein